MDARFGSFDNLTCPECDAKDIKTEVKTQTFRYGKEPNAVELTAEVPVRVCEACGFAFTDDEADQARDEVIRKHLGVFSPEEVRAVREKHTMDRAQFAELSGIGTASLARWESGALIQNIANDRYLYLLSFRDNLERLRTRFTPRTDTVELLQGVATQDLSTEISVLERAIRFRALSDPARCRNRARQFRLREPASCRR
ncbi:MAG: type II TA system antitoxin MqsA family protein [Acidobacteriaceae bacterium]